MTDNYLTVTTPYDQFTDLRGNPLNNGYIYIGEKGLDAESNPITVYWDADLTIAAEQPLRTLNGYIVNNGSAARVYVKRAVHSNYSMTVRDANMLLMYGAHYALAEASPETAEDTNTANTIVVNNIAGLRSRPVVNGQHVFRKCHTALGDSGAMNFIGITGKPVNTYVDNDGTIIVPTGGDGSEAWINSDAVITTAAFGMGNSNTVVNYHAALKAALEYACANDVKLVAFFYGGQTNLTQAAAPITVDVTDHLDFEIPAGHSVDVFDSSPGTTAITFNNSGGYQLNIYGGGKLHGERIANGFDGLKMGPFVSNADAAVNGYILVKDQDGNNRKLATIA